MFKYFFILFLTSSILFGVKKDVPDSIITKESFLTERQIIDSNYVHFELGIRDQIGLMFIENTSSNRTSSQDIKKMFYPMNLHLSIGISFLKCCKIDIRAGLIMVQDKFNDVDPEYGVFDAGMFFQINILKTKLYGITGFDVLITPSSPHGTSTFSEGGGDVSSICFGCGYKLTKNFDIDLMYYYPLVNWIGYSVDNLNPSRIRTEKIVNGLIILGFQYSFIF
jgi:hypothetical protein